MRLKLRAFSRYRPRNLTLIVFSLCLAQIVLENLCSESDEGSSFHFTAATGWPLRWHWLGFFLHPARKYLCHYSAGRLAVDVVIWLIVLAGPSGACEWLLRRYRPRPRWRLRTMLAGTAVAAALCAWFITARDRAKIQDPLIATRGYVWVKRSGPDWLELVGADRFRRRIVGMLVGTNWVDDGRELNVEATLKRLRQLPDLQYFFFEPSTLTVAEGDELATLLGDLRQLRVLTIGLDGIEDSDEIRGVREEHFWRECLAAIGKMSKLEALRIEGRPPLASHLAPLAGLTNLKSLSMEWTPFDPTEPESKTPLLSHLPALPALETLDLNSSEVGDSDLPYLRAFPRLRSLNLMNTRVTDLGLTHLASLEALEDIAICDGAVSLAGLRAVRNINRLNRLHLDRYSGSAEFSALELDDDCVTSVPTSDFENCVEALKALRQSHPGIVIDSDSGALNWPWPDDAMPPKYEIIPGTRRDWTLRFYREWKDWYSRRYRAS